MTRGTVRLGCAPINWTNDDLPELGGELTFEQCVSEMALAGFEGSEVGCKYPKDKATLKKARITSYNVCYTKLLRVDKSFGRWVGPLSYNFV